MLGSGIENRRQALDSNQSISARKLDINFSPSHKTFSTRGVCDQVKQISSAIRHLPPFPFYPCYKQLKWKRKEVCLQFNAMRKAGQFDVE